MYIVIRFDCFAPTKRINGTCINYIIVFGRKRLPEIEPETCTRRARKGYLYNSMSIKRGDKDIVVCMYLYFWQQTKPTPVATRVINTNCIKIQASGPHYCEQNGAYVNNIKPTE